MILRNKLIRANLLFKILFVGVFILMMPFLAERINLLQTDNELVDKREAFIDMISEWGVEPLLKADSVLGFQSYNLLNEEYFSLDVSTTDEVWNNIVIEQRQVDDELIDYRVLRYTLGIDGQFYLLEIGKSLASIGRAEHNIRQLTVGFLLLFIVVSVLFELVYTTRLLAPLQVLVRKIQTTTTPASFTGQPLATTTHDFLLLERTLTDLMKKADDLLRKEKEITQNISHELLTPISIMRSQLENLMLSEPLPEEFANKLQESLGTIHRLKALVSSLLLIARIESQQYLKQDELLAGDVLVDIVSELEPMAEDAGVRLTLALPANPPLKQVNRSLLFAMFYNVINNGIKFSKQGGSVVVETGFVDSRFRVKVTDGGNGIPPENLNSLFDRFRNKKKSVVEAGTGIGLAIVKVIADFHRIEIHVKSSSAEGTTFEFVFPH